MTSRKLKIIFKDRKLTSAIIFIIVGLFFLGHFVFKDKVTSKSNLIDINATLRSYSFKEHKGLKYKTFVYFLYLDKYQNSFQIIADFIEYFDERYFERSVKIGDTLRICISQNDFNNINNQDKIKIFGIYKNGETYLDCDNTIKDYNSKSILYGGLIFIIVGLIIYYFNKSKLKEEKNKILFTEKLQ